MSLFSKNLSKTCIRCRVDKVVTSFKVSLDLIFGRTHNEKKSFNALGALRPTFLINIVFTKYERVLFWKPNFDSHHQKYVVWYVTTYSTIVQKLKRERGHYNLQRPPTIVKWTIYVSSEAIIPKSQSTTQGNNHHNKWPLYCTYGVKSRNFPSQGL